MHMYGGTTFHTDTLETYMTDCRVPMPMVTYGYWATTTSTYFAAPGKSCYISSLTHPYRPTSGEMREKACLVIPVMLG